MADMTSEIASYTEDEQFLDEWVSDPERVWTPEEVAQIGIKDSPEFDPGTEWHYSNTNTILLGLVLEQVTAELLRERIVEPLGLKGTSFPGADPSLPDPHAQGYTLLPGQSGGEPADATSWNPSWVWTAGGVISTLDDLLVYGRALGTGEGLLSPAQQAERLDSFLTDGPSPNNADAAYGLGFYIDHGWIGHNGELPGFNTYLFYHPELDATVVVVVNSDIASGHCPEDKPTMTDGPQGIPCADPADRIFRALAEALGKARAGPGPVVTLAEGNPSALGIAPTVSGRPDQTVRGQAR